MRLLSSEAEHDEACTLIAGCPFFAGMAAADIDELYKQGYMKK